MMKLRHYTLLFIASLLMTFTAQAQERVIWDKQPIEVIIKPNAEKMVVLPTSSARVKIPAAITASLNTLSNDGVIYWTASEEFSSKRILIQDTDNNKTIVLNLTSDMEQGTDTPLAVLYKKDQSQQSTSETETSQQQNNTYGYETLTRVAAKHLYAPNRLISVPPNMHRVQVKQIPDSHLIRGHMIEMTPVISFSNAGLYVTAVKLTNMQRSKVSLDPRDIRGKWLAATFQHGSLGAAGSMTDTTALYLISKRPFWESF